MTAHGAGERHADGPGLALLDVDGTLTTVRSIWQHLLAEHGRWEGEGDVNLARFLAGEIGYEEFCHLDAALLAGVRYDALRAVCARVPRRPGLGELVAALHDGGYEIALVSTGLRTLTGLLVEEYGLAYCVANDLETDGGICTGRAVVEIGEDGKGRCAAELVARTRPRHVVAIGDGVSDVPMLGMADTAIAVGRVPDVVRAAAGVHVADGDLRAVVPHLSPVARVRA
ncbi:MULTISPECIES: HAD family phosphatase [Cellulosimicrobium]|uniref:HAD family hydrolase n=1 Tax=Cellulosimicrobium TaxID=157920 RepID=UPI001643A6D9|nr:MULTISPECIES: HAD family phosphatase [Cellulosimicrobium]MBE9938046.1 HAD-IB family phosphatase [Cellulosimicrobium cellulans]